MIAIDRSVADVRRSRQRFRRAAQAVRLGLIALARRVIAPLARVCTWRGELCAKVEPTDLALPVPSSAAPPSADEMDCAANLARRLQRAAVDVVEVGPDFDESGYAEMFARLQNPRSKLLDLRAVRVVKLSLFEHLVSTWQAPYGTVPQLGILFGYEHWIVLRNVAARRLRPLADQGVVVDTFYAQQAESVPEWFAGGEARHDRLPEVIEWLWTEWQPGGIWPAVLSRTAILIRESADIAAGPEMLVELAAIAGSFGDTEGVEQVAKHASTALAWIGDQATLARCGALRALAVATLARGKTEDGLALLDKAITTAAVLQDPIEEARALAMIGFEALRLGHYACAEDRIRTALALLFTGKPRWLRAMLHHDLARALLEQHKDLDEAELHAAIALRLRESGESEQAGEDIALIAEISARHPPSLRSLCPPPPNQHHEQLIHNSAQGR